MAKFFKYGVSVFDSRRKESGGFNHWIAKLFNWRITYLDIYLKRKCRFESHYNRNEDFYDGYHNYIWIGWILISYGL